MQPAVQAANLLCANKVIQSIMRFPFNRTVNIEHGPSHKTDGNDNAKLVLYDLPAAVDLRRTF